jgi:hypothetical protein
MMKKLLYFFPALLLFFNVQARTNEDQENIAGVRKLKKSLPFLFTENKGQVTDKAGKTRPDILFTANSGNTRLFLGPDAIHYQFSEPVKNAGKAANMKVHLLTLELQGANQQPVIRKEEQSIFRENFYTTSTSEQGITNVSTFGKVVYENVYPHIDWVLYSRNNSLKYDFVVHPGGDPAMIRLKVKDAEKVSITGDGALLMKTSLGEVKEKAPVSYADGQEVPSKFIANEDGSISFAVSAPPGATLIIDPSVTWSTYYGGSGVEDAQGFAKDAAGNLFVGGFTSSTNGIAIAGGFQTIMQGNADNFLVKFNAGGTPLWATYYGSYNPAVPSGNQESGGSCTTDNAGNVYMSGSIKTPFATNITTTGAYQTVHGGERDAYLVKFNGSGVRQWATFFGGSNEEVAYGCTTDASGNVFLSGITSSASGIASPGAFQATYGGGNATDLFLAKFNSTGILQWSTYYGGSGDEGSDIGIYYTLQNVVTDNLGNVLLAGTTTSVSGIATPGAQQTVYAGQSDAFLVKFDAAGNRLWGTYFGGPDQEGFGVGLATDGGNVYLTGSTYSLNNISTAGAYQAANAGGGDNFLAKFNNTGNLQWATYLGGVGWEYHPSATVNPVGAVILTSGTYSTSGINTVGGLQLNNAGSSDGLIAKFSPAGTMIWSSYFGGTGTDIISAAVTSGQDIFLMGMTESTTGIATPGAFKTTITGSGLETFLTRISDIPACVKDSITVTENICSNQLPYTWHGISIPAGGTAVTSDTLTNAGGCDSIIYLNLVIKLTPATVIVNDTICRNSLPFIWNSITVNAPPTGNIATAIYTAAAANGCDSITNLHLFLKDTVKVTDHKTYCRNLLPTVWNGITIPATAVSNTAYAVYNTTNVSGCDSIVTLNLTVNNTYTINANDTICRNDLPLTWNGLTVNVAPGNNTATAVYNALSAQGCDSIVTLHLYVREPSATTVSHTICSNLLPYLWNGISVTTGGAAAAVFTTTNIAGCDSVVTLNLTVNNSSVFTAAKNICSNQLPYLWNGISVPAGGLGVATYTTTNAAGCDSVVTLNLNVQNTASSVDNVTICSFLLPYTWHGISVTAGGPAAATFTLLNTTGCDSVITLNLSVTPSVSPTVSITVSPGSTVPSGTPVTFTATITNGGTLPVLQWKKNGVNVGINSATYTDFSIDSADVITCTLWSNVACAAVDSAVSNTITMVIVTPPPPCLVPLTLISTDIQFSAAVFRWAAVNGAAGYEFVLDMQPGNPSSGLFTTDTVYHASALSPGVYYFHIRTRCANGDSSPWITIKITIQDETGTGTVDLNGDGKGLSLYPNPNNGVFNVLGNLPENKAMLDIIDKSGRTIYRKEAITPGGKLNHRVNLAGSIAQGVYLLRVNSGNQVYVLRFVYN